MRGDWRRVFGIGRSGTVFASRPGKRVAGTVGIDLPAGEWTLSVEVLPTYPDKDGAPLTLDVGVDGRREQLRAARVTGDTAWAQAVLDNRIVVAVPGSVAGGRHRLTLGALDGGVLIDRVVARRK